MRNKHWARGEVPAGEKRKVFGLFMVALLWNALTVPALLALPSELKKGNYAILVILLFAFVGVVLIGLMVYTVVQYLRYGESVLQLATVPGGLGGVLGGAVRTRVVIESPEDVALTLRCSRLITTGSGKNRRTSRKVVWEQTRHGTELLRDEQGLTAIPVEFNIPYDCPETDDSDPDNRVEWDLDVHADVPGVDFQASFAVPVFMIETSNPQQTRESVSVAGEHSAEDFRWIEAAGLRITPVGDDGLMIVVPRCRSWSAVIVLSVLNLVMAGAVALIIAEGIYWALAPAGLFGFFFVYGWLKSVLWHSRFRVEPEQVTLYSGWLGEAHRFTVSPEDVEEIKLTANGAGPSGEIFDLEVLRDGKSHVLASSLPNRDVAERLLRTVKARFHGESFDS